MTIWYLARATGLVALIAFTVATALGASASRVRSDRSDAALDRRYLTQTAHRSAAVLGLALLALHATLIVIDSYVQVSVPSLLVPFTSGYRPLAIGLGTLATYAFAVVSLSGALRGRLAASAGAARRWRVVHLGAYLGWGLSMGHGVLAGTDTGATWSTAIYVACGLTVLAALALRLRDRRTPQISSLHAARTLVRSSS